MDIQAEDGKIKITDKEDVQIIGKDLPDDFPQVLPINNDIEIITVYSAVQDGKAGWSERQDTVQNYGDQGINYTYQVNNDTYLVTVFANETDERTEMSLGVVEK